jgi:hypothetical protein
MADTVVLHFNSLIPKPARASQQDSKCKTRNGADPAQSQSVSCMAHPDREPTTKHVVFSRRHGDHTSEHNGMLVFTAQALDFTQCQRE